MSAIFILPTKSGTYFKVTETGKSIRKNIGCIEKDGTLNVKIKLKSMIRKAGGKPAYIKSRSGRTRGVGGSGYDSYTKFPTQSDGEKFLRALFP